MLSLSGWWLISANRTILWVFVFLFSAGGDVLFNLSAVVILFLGASAAEELFFYHSGFKTRDFISNLAMKDSVLPRRDQNLCIPAGS